jgi:hypothetical protein
MQNAQPKMSLEAIEVAVFVQQLMAIFDAKRGDDAVDGSADGNALLAKRPIVLRGKDCQFSAASVKDSELQQIPAKLTKLGIASDSLQNLAQYQARQPDFLLANRIFQPDGLAIDNVVKVVNPNGCIDNHHALSTF